MPEDHEVLRLRGECEVCRNLPTEGSNDFVWQESSEYTLDDCIFWESRSDCGGRMAVEETEAGVVIVCENCFNRNE